MPRYYSDDDDETRSPRIVDDPSDSELDQYFADFSSFIYQTKCSLCDNHGPCLPIHLPFFQQQVFICADCLFLLHQHLACAGYFEQSMNQDIREGKVREMGGEKTSADYVNVEPLSSSSPEDVPLHVSEEVIEEFELQPLAVDHEDPGPQYEEGYLVVDFSDFFQDGPVFSDPPEFSEVQLVSEVLMRRKVSPTGSYSWVDIVPANDLVQKQGLLDEYLSGSNLSRLFRGAISFSIILSHRIDGQDSLEDIQFQLTDLIEAIQQLQAWHSQDKVKIIQTSTSPAIIDFLASVDIFSEVLVHPGISSYIIEDEIVTLAGFDS